MIPVHRVRVDEAPSTQDLCRDVCAASKLKDFVVLVTAASQNHGRGSGGRSWISAKGNCFTTIGVPHGMVKPHLLPVLPLAVGCCVVECVRKFVSEDRTKSVLAKWPNDVLIEKEKVSGCLIEDSDSHFLIGVGINVAFGPENSDGGRRTTSIHAHSSAAPDADTVAESLCQFLLRDLTKVTSREDVVETYKSMMAWDCDMYTRQPDGSRGAKVRAVSMSNFGELTVANVDTGVEFTLVADYLL